MQSKVRAISYGGLLTAISIILTRLFSAPIHIGGFYALRLGLGGIPIILSGLLLGPWVGAGVGIAADVIGMAIFPSGPYFPGFTLSSALSGFIPGLLVGNIRNHITFRRLFAAVAVSDLITSVLLNTLWLSIMAVSSANYSSFGTAFYTFLIPRLVTRCVLIPIYSALIFILLKPLRAQLAHR